MNSFQPSSVQGILDRLLSLPRPPVPASNGQVTFSQTLLSSQRPAVDLVIVPNEVCMAHGTGVLLTRILEDADSFVVLRSFTHWGGDQAVRPLADLVLPDVSRARSKRATIARFVAEHLQYFDVRRIVSVPYFHEDVLATLVAKAVTGAPLSVYPMDDHVLFHPAIPREDMAELFEMAEARFAISPEMRTAYQNAFRAKFSVLPPVVADRFVRRAPSASPAVGQGAEAVMIGNIWHQSWLERLWETLRDSDLRLTWYASNEDHHWLKLPAEAVASGRFRISANLPTPKMIEAVEKAAFVIIPSGTFAEVGHQLAISRLSLPSRMPFIVATAGTPMLVLGEPESAAGKFVRRFDLGEVARYDVPEVRGAVAKLLDPARQKDIRARAFTLGPVFRSSGIYRILTQAAEAGGVLPDVRFEDVFAIQHGEFGYYIPEPVGDAIIPDQVDMVRAFRRLKALGFTPDTVIDVGASSGIWSYTLHEVYPEARYVLVDPLFSRYPNKNLRDGFEVLECAIADKPGRLTLQVSDDLYNSSIVAVGNVAKTTEEIAVEVKTVDQVARETQARGRIVLKLDVQFAEHLALEGAVDVLANQVDVVMLELTLERPTEQAKTFREMVDLMAGYGFDYFDEVGEWRQPATGRLEQKDVLFARRGLLPPP